MGKTFAEKILALKSGKKSVKAGEIVTVSPDVVLSHDNTAAISKKFIMPATCISLPRGPPIIFIESHPLLIKLQEI